MVESFVKTVNGLRKKLIVLFLQKYFFTVVWQVLKCDSIFSWLCLTHFQPMYHFYTPWKHQTDDFRGYRSETLVENGLSLAKIYIFLPLCSLPECGEILATVSTTTSAAVWLFASATSLVLVEELCWRLLMTCALFSFFLNE